LEGQVKIGDHQLDRRDALGIWETDDFTVEAIPSSEVLVIEVPM
jgi:hypothetical protein